MECQITLYNREYLLERRDPQCEVDPHWEHEHHNNDGFPLQLASRKYICDRVCQKQTHQCRHYGKQKAVRQSTYGVRTCEESGQIVKCKPALAVGEGIINNYKQWCNYKAYEK